MSFVVYRSSAGSGKTFTLVKEYLKLCLVMPSKFRNILGITFTNKASDEMKSKIIESLYELSELNTVSPDFSKGLPKVLIQETGLSPAQIRNKATLTLILILHNYADFSISTIDSFNHRIIRTFAQDLRISSSFEVTLDTAEMLGKVTDILISRAGIDKDLTGLLTDFVLSLINDEKSWVIEKELNKFAGLILNEESHLYIKKIRGLSIDDFYESIKKIRNSIRDFENHLCDCGKNFMVMINNAGIPQDAFFQGKKGIGKYFGNFSNQIFRSVKPNSFVIKTIEEDIWYAAKTSPDLAYKIDNMKCKAAEMFRDLNEYIEQHASFYYLCNQLKYKLYRLFLINSYLESLEEYYKLNNTIHISEFNKRIYDVIAGEPVPFIYERLGTRFQHIMIDEFQDTSVLQWSNLIPLVENSLSENHFNMVVGDAKQAIYRWRGGDANQLVNLPSLSGYGDNKSDLLQDSIFGRYYKPYVLDHNFRSKPEIVRFNNRFFSLITRLSGPETGNYYADLEQKYDENDSGGYVELNFIDAGENKDLVSMTSTRILDVIKALTESSGNFRKNDISILCRTNSIAVKIAGFLLQNGIPVVSSESLLLNGSAEIRSLIHILKLAGDPSDKISFAALLQTLRMINHKLEWSTKFSFSVDTLHDVIKGKTDYFKEFADIAGIPYEELRPANHLNLYTLTESIVNNLEFNINNPFIQTFLGFILQYEMNIKGDIRDFIDYYESQESKLSVSLLSGNDAVKVMTIHKSKGLQFPVVIYPAISPDDSVSTKTDPVWIDFNQDPFINIKAILLNYETALNDSGYSNIYEKELAKRKTDFLNLIYVAFTRARSRMYVFLPGEEKKAGHFDTVTGIVKTFLEQNGLWSPDMKTYSFGDPEIAEKKTGDQEPAISNQISGSITIHPDPGVRKADVFPRYQSLRAQYTADFGNIIHKIFARIYLPEDIDEALQWAIDHELVEADDAGKIRPLAENVMNHPEIKQYFMSGPEVKNEKELILPDGHFIRPDKVVSFNDHIAVIDYKTGNPEPGHIRQVTTYASALGEMTGMITRPVIIYLYPSIKIITR